NSLNVATAAWRGKNFCIFSARNVPQKIPSTLFLGGGITIATLPLSGPSSPFARGFFESAGGARKMFFGVERGARIMDCGSRFAGRRKTDGGYAYYDLWQNRAFDIAGPNPTANERTQIYAEYRRFLDLQRQEVVLAEVQQPVAEELRIVASS